MMRISHIATCVLAMLLIVGCGDQGADSKQAGRSDASSSKASGSSRLDDLTKELGNAATVATGAGCSIETPRMVDATHEADPDPDEWSSTPPTSGAHNQEWASWGRYDTPVEDKHVIHNLEHGGVALWLGTDTSDELITAIDAKLLKEGKKWIAVPRPDFTGFAAASWGTLLTCDSTAMKKLGTSATITLLASWYNATNSKQTLAEARIPAYAGTMKQPRPVKDISLPLPSF